MATLPIECEDPRVNVSLERCTSSTSIYGSSEMDASLMEASRDLSRLSSISSTARDRLVEVKRQGKVRLRLLRLPTMTVAFLTGLNAVATVVVGTFVFPAMTDIIPVSIPMTWAEFIFALGLLPSDRRLIRCSMYLIGAPLHLLMFLLLSFGAMEALSKESESCSYGEQNAPCEYLTIRGISLLLNAFGNLAIPVVFFAFQCRKSKTDTLLRKLWFVYGMANGCWASTRGIESILYFVNASFPYAIGDLLCAISHTTLAYLSLHPHFIKRMQMYLMSRGEAAAAAAGVAELLAGCSAERVLEIARKNFRCVSAKKLTKEDMARKDPDPALAALAQKVLIGHGDAFVSHSWSDDAEAKWAAIQEWREDFKKAHGREPLVWLDKYSIDQNNIEESLTCLPAYLAGCKQLLIICGHTYLDRLWCLVEIMVFLEMGGYTSKLDIKLLKNEAGNVRSSVRMAVTAFDPRNAVATTEYDTSRLRDVIEVTGYDRIAELVSDVFDAHGDSHISSY